MFFLSLSLILLLGVVIDLVFEKINIPSLIGLLLLGLGLNQLGLIDESILEISSDLRKIALIIILLKAGLSLDFNILKRVGRPAILMCFVPATFEIIGFAIFGPMILNLSFVESLLIGSVLGAVSPAIVIQRMTNLIDRGIGIKKGIPQMLIAGSSADDIYCIVIFTALAGMLA
ncbi:MAG TPA: cation:proton antiporter, partial [Clostridia bacterium]